MSCPNQEITTPRQSTFMILAYFLACVLPSLSLTRSSVQPGFYTDRTIFPRDNPPSFFGRVVLFAFADRSRCGFSSLLSDLLHMHRCSQHGHGIDAAMNIAQLRLSIAFEEIGLCTQRHHRVRAGGGFVAKGDVTILDAATHWPKGFSTDSLKNDQCERYPLAGE